MNKKNPAWWTNEHESSWERTKTALGRDWEQTKHDLGSKTAPNLKQSAGDTVKQAAGEPVVGTFATHEHALRYGHGANYQYGDKAWDDDVEAKVQRDYDGDWSVDRSIIRRGYDYRTPKNI